MVKLIAEFSKAFCNAVQSEREKLGSIDAVLIKGERCSSIHRVKRCNCINVVKRCSSINVVKRCSSIRMVRWCFLFRGVQILNNTVFSAMIYWTFICTHFFTVYDPKPLLIHLKQRAEVGMLKVLLIYQSYPLHIVLHTAQACSLCIGARHKRFWNHFPTSILTNKRREKMFWFCLCVCVCVFVLLAWCKSCKLATSFTILTTTDNSCLTTINRV